MKSFAQLIFALLLFVAASNSHALEGTTITLAEAQELFRAGNAAYQQQNYAEARSKYLQLAESGVRSPELFYNLGNAAARLNRKSEAVLYLSRAHELDPHDPDIEANLRRIAPISVTSLLSASHPLRWTANRLSLREWVLLFLALYFVVGLAGAAYLTVPRRVRMLKYLAFTSLGACLLIMIFGGYKYYETYYLQYGVIAKPTISVRSGPADTFAQVNLLGEGEIVKSLSSTEEGWQQVQLADGRKGYVPQSQILLI